MRVYPGCSRWRFVFWLLAWAALGGVVRGAPTAPSDADGEARDEYAAVLRLSQETMPRELRADPPAAAQWSLTHITRLQELGRAFLARYPAHPRRWDVLMMIPRGDRFAINERNQVFPDAKSRAEADESYWKAMEALVVAPDASPYARGDGLRQLISHSSLEGRRLPRDQARAVAVKVRAWCDQYERDAPIAGEMASMHANLAALLEWADPPEAVRFLEGLLRTHVEKAYYSESTRWLAEGHLRAIKARTDNADALWADLRALDPRFADTARYRGKVVLIATAGLGFTNWLEELSGWYTQLHGAGFEIIQVITSDYSVGSPPEAAQRERMLRTVAEKGWPWTFVWEKGSVSAPDFSKRWGMMSYPGFLLIGRDNRVVADTVFPLEQRAVMIPREVEKQAGK